MADRRTPTFDCGDVSDAQLLRAAIDVRAEAKRIGEDAHVLAKLDTIVGLMRERDSKRADLVCEHCAAIAPAPPPLVLPLLAEGLRQRAAAGGPMPRPDELAYDIACALGVDPVDLDEDPDGLGWACEHLAGILVVKAHRRDVL